MAHYILLMRAETYVHIEAHNAKQWFFGLKDHPERYTFASHGGFYFIEGNFGEVGSRFYTKERFHGMLLKLTFSLTEVTSNSFAFELLKPIRNIKGIYTITKSDNNMTLVSLSVYARTKRIRLMFKMRPFYRVIQKQINSEVKHIKKSMESNTLISTT